MTSPVIPVIPVPSSSSFISAWQLFQPHRRTSGGFRVGGGVFFFFLYHFISAACRAAFSAASRRTSGGFRVGGGVHDSYTFQCGLVGSFTSPGIDSIRHQIEGTNGFYCLTRKTLAKRGKRNCQSSEEKSFYRSGTRTIDRPVDSLTHSATAPPRRGLVSCYQHSFLIAVFHC